MSQRSVTRVRHISVARRLFGAAGNRKLTRRPLSIYLQSRASATMRESAARAAET